MHSRGIRVSDGRAVRILLAEVCMKEKKKTEQYAHNPHYCMIRPGNGEDEDEEIVSTGQS